MQRRGVALEVAKLMSYKAHDKLVGKYLRAVRHPVIEGYKGVTMQQVYLADAEVFSVAAQILKCDLSGGANGSYPLDQILEDLLGDEQVKMLLTQMPAPAHGVKRDSAELDRLKEENKRLKSEAQSSMPSNPSKGKSAGKGKKNKRGKMSTPMPKEL
eukprot:6075443-Karenia_brevis.AAC.1